MDPYRKTGLIVCIDPGVSCGLAIFSDGRLIDAYYVKDPMDFDIPIKADLVCLEHLYSDKSSPVPTRSIIDAQLWGAYLAGRFQGPIRLIAPSTWKGSRDKAVHNKWIMKQLTPDEARIVAGSTKNKTEIHNVIDAAGIGIWHHQRPHRR